MNEETERFYKFTEEMRAIGQEPPSILKLPKPVVFSLISAIQLASRHPAAATGNFVLREAIDTAKQWQKAIFSEYATASQILEDGWDAKCDRPAEELPPKERPTVEKPITAKLSWPMACSLIRCIQFTAKNAQGAEDDERIRMGVAFALDLQKQLDPESEDYKLLEEGWHETVPDEPDFIKMVQEACEKMGFKVINLE